MLKQIMRIAICALIPFIASAAPLTEVELPDELGLIALNKKSNYLCTDLSKVSAGIRDMCLAVGAEERQYEYIMCSPDRSKGETSRTHYIAQTEWSDKDQQLDQKLTNLYIGFGGDTTSLLELQNISLIDTKLEFRPSLDLNFSSPVNGLDFELTILSNDGEYLEGTVIDHNTNETIELQCRDLAI